MSPAPEAPDPRLAAYTYDLPAEAIARYPSPDRADARLLVLREDERHHAHVRDLPGLLRSGDLLVLNDTRVHPARLLARRASGGAVEILLTGFEEGTVTALCAPGRRLKPGEVLSIEGAEGSGSVELVSRDDEGTWVVRTRPSAVDLAARWGRVPLPPYLQRDAEPDDLLRYQTTFASGGASSAAPTAGLHFTLPLLDELRGRGVEVTTLRLDVGIGTFRNLRPEDLDRGTLHRESYEIPRSTAEAVARAQLRGGRVVAVGTTVTRALEASARADGTVRAGPAWTDLFIREGYRFRIVDRLLTNYHLPMSSLLMLVCAFGGRARVLDAYRHAIAAGYRFYSYGDAMLLDRLETPCP